MDPDFSERQFEIAVNSELTHALRSHMAYPVPEVPSTREEAKQGWDALIRLGSGYWYFLQYKVAILATRATGRNRHFWRAHGGRYFRFILHCDSRGQCHQHYLLSELRNALPGVYYCAPGFITNNDFWEHVGNSTIVDSSMFIDLADVPLSDYSGRHQISYDGSGRVLVWSEPEGASSGKWSSEVLRNRANWHEVNKLNVARLFARAVQIVTGSTVRQYGVDWKEAWMRARLLEEPREAIRAMWDGEDFESVVSEIAERVPADVLLASTSRILSLDFGLSWIIEPAK